VKGKAMSDYSRFEIDQDMIEYWKNVRLAWEDWIRSLSDDEAWNSAVNAMREFARECANLIEPEWYPGMKGRGIKVRKKAIDGT
jgi:hypothetical protein